MNTVIILALLNFLFATTTSSDTLPFTPNPCVDTIDENQATIAEIVQDSLPGSSCLDSMLLMQRVFYFHAEIEDLRSEPNCEDYSDYINQAVTEINSQYNDIVSYGIVHECCWAYMITIKIAEEQRKADISINEMYIVEITHKYITHCLTTDENETDDKTIYPDNQTPKPHIQAKSEVPFAPECTEINDKDKVTIECSTIDAEIGYCQEQTCRPLCPDSGYYNCWSRDHFSMRLTYISRNTIDLQPYSD
ncbi:hypothetical protein COT97_05540 [Candidatus Falkowbacteria bacterium CG10_big_fil_rev_8_21_14_0_10_39_11]|uniref:Uncharacterized protein n=1 Tax=Candidatus Falkowbacteria bacterium CG10_big_fil_rev_8_21_14_0_10_39_11 TaxID=1974565 RepID=A0A2H0V3G5_9BACT|nr:MAG: hypothetical protein COT97_05540 [Candidatus Falkowbacteria bacterium CG10_big_fil_rev_8_21_14_0_10_39_11]